MTSPRTDQELKALNRRLDRIDAVLLWLRHKTGEDGAWTKLHTVDPDTGKRPIDLVDEELGFR